MVATEPRFTATGDEGGDVAAGVGTGTTWLGIGSFVWGSRQLLYSKSFKIYIYISSMPKLSVKGMEDDAAGRCRSEDQEDKRKR